MSSDRNIAVMYSKKDNKIKVFTNGLTYNLPIMLFKNDVFVDITQKNDTFDVKVEKGIGEKYDVLYEAHFIKEQFVFETIKEYLLKDNI